MLAAPTQSPVVTVEPGFTMREAAHRLDEPSVGALVVVDSTGHALGILTDRDLDDVPRRVRRGPSDLAMTIDNERSLERAATPIRRAPATG